MGKAEDGSKSKACSERSRTGQKADINSKSKVSSRVNEQMSERVNEEKHALINTYTHQLIYSICSTSVESIRQIDLFLQNKAKFHIRSQNTEDKNVYMCLPNKELRSANPLGVSQDVIKNQHKNKAKTNPIYPQCKAGG